MSNCQICPNCDRPVLPNSSADARAYGSICLSDGNCTPNAQTPAQSSAAPTNGDLPAKQRRQYRHEESDEQREFFKLVYQLEERYPCLKMCYAVLNGGWDAGSVRKGGIWKAMGRRAGVADVKIDIPVWAGEGSILRIPGCFLEFKRPKQKQSVAQKAFQVEAEYWGFLYFVVYSAVEAWECLRAYLWPVVELPGWGGG